MKEYKIKYKPYFLVKSRDKTISSSPPKNNKDCFFFISNQVEGITIERDNGILHFSNNVKIGDYILNIMAKHRYTNKCTYIKFVLFVRETEDEINNDLISISSDSNHGKKDDKDHKDHKNNKDHKEHKEHKEHKRYKRNKNSKNMISRIISMLINNLSITNEYLYNILMMCIVFFMVNTSDTYDNIIE
jgi:hypothetical protein